MTWLMPVCRNGMREWKSQLVQSRGKKRKGDDKCVMDDGTDEYPCIYTQLPVRQTSETDKGILNRITRKAGWGWSWELEGEWVDWKYGVDTLSCKLRKGYLYVRVDPHTHSERGRETEGIAPLASLAFFLCPFGWGRPNLFFFPDQIPLRCKPPVPCSI